MTCTFIYLYLLLILLKCFLPCWVLLCSFPCNKTNSRWIWCTCCPSVFKPELIHSGRNQVKLCDIEYRTECDKIWTKTEIEGKVRGKKVRRMAGNLCSSLFSSGESTFDPLLEPLAAAATRSCLRCSRFLAHFTKKY